MYVLLFLHVLYVCFTIFTWLVCMVYCCACLLYVVLSSHVLYVCFTVFACLVCITIDYCFTIGGISVPVRVFVLCYFRQSAILFGHFT